MAHGVKIHIAIPTLLSSRSPHVIGLCRAAADVGHSVAVFANGRDCYAQLCDAGLDVLTARRNVGFGSAVNRAIARRPVDATWVMVMNDDIEIDDFTVIGRAIVEAGDCSLVSFGDEILHRIPRKRDVFESVSMLSGFRRRTTRKRDAVRDRVMTVASEHYSPFSLVAVRTDLWDQLNGLDERFPFSFEDSDFSRRARDLGAVRRVVTVPGVRHLRGETGKAHVSRTLPAAVWGAYSYLAKWETPRPLAVALCLLGLVARLPLVPAAKVNRREHLRGIMRACTAIVRDTRPEMPSYDEF